MISAAEGTGAANKSTTSLADMPASGGVGYGSVKGLGEDGGIGVRDALAGDGEARAVVSGVPGMVGEEIANPVVEAIVGTWAKDIKVMGGEVQAVSALEMSRNINGPVERRARYLNFLTWPFSRLTAQSPLELGGYLSLYIAPAWLIPSQDLAVSQNAKTE
jgi:hypothetical protein